MIFNQLTNSIRNTNNTLRSYAGKAINQFLTVRNWLIGFYIVEFEQHGDDRAKYGEKLLESIADELRENSLSYRILNLYRQFFQTYPQIGLVLPAFVKKNNLLEIWQSVIAILDEQPKNILQSPIAKLQNTENQSFEIVQSPIAQFNNPENSIGQSLIAQSDAEFLVEPQRLLSELSYTHLVQLFPIKDPLKRAFYEIECINGCWSVRELQRQIG